METLDATKVSELVVTERLNQVATQLSKVTQEAKSDEMALEDELLNDDPKLDTPAQLSKTASPKAAGTPAEPTGNAIDDTVGAKDSVGDRVNQIFGSKRRAIGGDGNGSSPKVANIVVNNNVDAAIKEVSDSPTHKSPVDKIVTPPVAMDVSDEGEGNAEGAPEGDANNIPDGEEEEPEDEPEDGEWADEDDNPQQFPDMGFPMQVPGYPMQPIFHYRYRTLNSTPRGRRIDFDRSIVLRKCDRDRHTGRIAQEEYEAREDAEMALSLG